MPKWEMTPDHIWGEFGYNNCYLWVNRDLSPNGWSYRRRAKDLCRLLARPAVRWATQHYLKDPDSNPLPLSAKRLTASEFEYYQ